MLLIFLFWFLELQCRQAKISYTGTFMADVCFKYNDGVVVRDKFDFGQFPIMLMVGDLFLWFCYYTFFESIPEDTVITSLCKIVYCWNVNQSESQFSGRML